MSVLLTRRAVVQADIEATYNAPVTLGSDDGVLCADPVYRVEPNVLERNFVRDSLSPQAHIVGRKLSKMEFTTELRGNGSQNSGLIGNAPILTRLFRAAGYAIAAHDEPTAKGPYDIDAHANSVAWTVGSLAAATNTDMIAYYIAVTLGGASGVAKITVTSDTTGEGSAEAAITTATEVDLGTEGLAITPVFTGSLTIGQKWIVWLLPAGLTLTPISDAFESVTLAMYKDGVKHLMPGSFGTFEIEATAGGLPSVKWTFTGTYQSPIDATMPVPVYERQLPSQVELARLRMHDFSAVVEKFTFNQGNDIQIRPDVSSNEGYIGTRIVSRKPEGGVNPEADLVANYDFWSKMADANRIPFQMRVGTVPGNIVWTLAPGVQYTGMTYADRNGILTYDAGLRFPAYLTNDEIFFHFC